MKGQAQDALRKMAASGVMDAQVNTILSVGVIEGQPVNAIRQLRQALEKVHGKTVTIIDKNGDPMRRKVGYYAKMVAITKTREATRIARHARLKDQGIDLVRIIGKISENFCTAYLVKIFSISGTSDKYPPLSSLPGGGPPFHPNCSKGTAPFIEALADPAVIDAGKPDSATDKMLNNQNRSQLQRLYQDFNMHKRVEGRLAKIRNDAGHKVATHAGDDPKYQEHLLRQLGVEHVDLAGRSDIGAIAVRAAQQSLSAGGGMPLRVEVKTYVDSATGLRNADVPAYYIPSRRTVVYNPDYPGWRDAAKSMDDAYKKGFISSPKETHPGLHEHAHDELLQRGVNHNNAPFQFASEWKTAGKVSLRAKKNKDEFLAEYRAARIAGIKFDDDVAALHRKLGGS